MYFNTQWGYSKVDTPTEVCLLGYTAIPSQTIAHLLHNCMQKHFLIS